MEIILTLGQVFWGGEEGEGAVSKSGASTLRNKPERTPVCMVTIEFWIKNYPNVCLQFFIYLAEFSFKSHNPVEKMK